LPKIGGARLAEWTRSVDVGDVGDVGDSEVFITSDRLRQLGNPTKKTVA
jgi:hypothetical protein